MGKYNKCIDAVFIGYDASEHKAYEVAKYTIEKHTSTRVFPIVQDALRAEGLYTRHRDLQASNDFSLTRFLTPVLARRMGFEVALFCDCDMLFTKDLNEMLRGNDLTKGVYVVKHDYTPKTNTKMDGKVQHTYPKKNWASVMLFNVMHPALKTLTPKYVNNATPSQLHQFKWMEGYEIGELSKTWNFLVGEYPDPEFNTSVLAGPSIHTPANLHYTLGLPQIHDELFTTSYAYLWETTYNEMLANKNDSE